MRKFSINPLQGNFLDPYIIVLKFETNGSSDPDGLVHDYGDDLKVEHSGSTGEYTLTFAGHKKPWFVAVLADHEEDDADLRVVSEGYVNSTGVAKLKTYTNSAGTWSAANTTDKTVVVVLYCTDKSEGGRLSASS